MVQGSNDRRVLRTKKLLRSVLGELVEEKGLDGITVSDLTERAGINRGTFYLHYRDKNDLIHNLEDEILSEVLSVGEGLEGVTLEDVYVCYSQSTPLPFAVGLFDYLRENGLFVSALIGPKGDPGFQPRFQTAVMSELVPGILNDRYRVSITPLTRYYIAYQTGALISVIKSWLDHGMEENSQEMARITVAIMFMAPGDPIVMPRRDQSETTVPSHAHELYELELDGDGSGQGQRAGISDKKKQTVEKEVR